jgi:hypothetical protein
MISWSVADPDPLARGMDPDPSIVKQKLLCDFFMTFYL